MNHNPWDFFKEMADSGLKKSIQSLDEIDEVNEAHYLECAVCQSGAVCDDMELRKMYRETDLEMAAYYMALRDWIER
jgi:hypothetical protein